MGTKSNISNKIMFFSISCVLIILINMVVILNKELKGVVNNQSKIVTLSNKKSKDDLKTSQEMIKLANAVLENRKAIISNRKSVLLFAKAKQ